ncbi:MAG TPA: hypothetical protein PLB39_05100, partial [Thermoleophilia bacterium]|nr:hypothetical protein [Thermoleophilia bacterium]
MVAKYTSAGKRVWLKRYTAAGTGHFADVAFDRSGNVYVAATVEYGTSKDIVVLKYSAAGALRWATPLYDSGENGPDEAVKLAVDAKGGVVVLGESDRTGLTGIVVLKCKQKNGKPAWAKPWRWDLEPSNPDAGPARAADLALDGKGDIYVAGSYEYLGLEGAALFKVAGAKGTKLKGDVYEPRHGDASSYEALTVRGSSVVATGSAWKEGVDGSRNALIVKFDRGLQMKASKEWGVGNKSEEWFYAAVIDGKGSVFVTGEQWLEDKYEKVVTMKLDAKLKKVVWSTTYMPASKYAMGLHIARDGAGNVYVGGVKNPDLPKQAVLTIKYSAAGARKWVRTWSGGSGGSISWPAGFVLGSKDGVYVGGHAWSKAGVHQAVLLKYRR